MISSTTVPLVSRGMTQTVSGAGPRPSSVVVLAIAAVTLAGFGLVAIQSATAMRAGLVHDTAGHYVMRQVAGLLLGVGAAMALWRADPGTLRRLTWPAYVATLGLLLLVASPLGHEAGGATRWLVLGPIHVQPSEIAKLTVVGVLADYLAQHRGRLTQTIRMALPGFGLVLPAVALVVLQRDFGTTAILLALMGVLFVLAGLRWVWMAAGAAGGLGMLGALVAIEPYRWNRLLAFLDPEANASGTGFQVVQAWVALSEGGPFGVGLGHGLVQRGFLPEVHNDFIVAVIGEELGAMGIAGMVLLQIMFVSAAFAIAKHTPTLFGRFVAAGIGTLFAIQATINIGVVGGVFPTKGLVLPFVSYGASAAAVHAFAVGVLMHLGGRRGG